MWPIMSSCSGVMRAVGDLDPHHLVVAALALAVDAVVQAEDPEDVLVELAGQVAGELLLELLDVGELALDRSHAAASAASLAGQKSDRGDQDSPVVTNPIGPINIPDLPDHLCGLSTSEFAPSDRTNRGRGSAGPEQLGDLEGQVERLAAVEPGVAHRLVAVVEVAVEELARRRRGTR